MAKSKADILIDAAIAKSITAAYLSWTGSSPTTLMQLQKGIDFNCEAIKTVRKLYNENRKDVLVILAEPEALTFTLKTLSKELLNILEEEEKSI